MYTKGLFEVQLSEFGEQVPINYIRYYYLVCF